MKKKVKRKTGCLIFLVLGILLLAFGVKYGWEEGEEILYPRKYSEYVEKYAAQYGVDEDLIYAVIKTESDFDPNAVSQDNAKGLMQITESTFDWITMHLPAEEKGEVHDDLFDPERNIHYGVFLLSYLLEEFEYSEVALAAYHAGRGITNQWLQNPQYSADGKTLAKIPYSDTAHYVDKVMKHYRHYQKDDGAE